MNPPSQSPPSTRTLQQTAPQPGRGEHALPGMASLPGENLTIAETLRVMDVARELRQQRETAENLFRQQSVRVRLREKLLRTAELSGDRVTEAEIDTAIDQYLSNLHTYESPKFGFKKFVAYCWIWRYRIVVATVAIGAVAAYLAF